VVRAGVLSVSTGKTEAAQALGLRSGTILRLVVVPQAMRVIIPPLGNTFNSLLKTTSLASVISMEELLRRTEVLIQVQFKVLEIFIVAAFYYLVMTTIWGFIQVRLETHFSRSHAPAKARGAAFASSEARAEIEKVLLSHDAQ
jgi:polar amino acid transport system permease protein